MNEAPTASRTVYLIATEESGDRLGAALMRALRDRLGDRVTFEGVGGASMAAEGLVSLFPIEQLSIMGFAAVAQKLPMILRLLRRATDAVLMADPDVLVIIDSPDFTQRVARRVHARNASIPIVNYVSPTVWAWRPGRASDMRGYVDHVLALLPFEPEVHRKLGGPPCTYVGHPLIEQTNVLRPSEAEQQRRDSEPPILLVLPGSRRSEIRHHMAIFGETLARLRGMIEFELVLPTMPHLLDVVTEGVKTWTVQPRIVVGEDEKRAAFRSARAAFAKSGTVTLELAVAGVPMVAAYQVHPVEAFIVRRVIKTTSVILANLVIGHNVVPEFIQEACTTKNIVPALLDILIDSPARQRQLAAFAELDQIMATDTGSPSVGAADVVLKHLRRRTLA